MSQRSFASAEYVKKKRMRRETLLADMGHTVPSARLIVFIDPLCSANRRVERQPVGIAKMRMYRPQQWYGLADEVLKDTLQDSQVLRDLMGIDLSRESVPDQRSWFDEMPSGFILRSSAALNKPRTRST